MNDAVNHPSHYNTGKHEVIDVIYDWGLDFDLGNTTKYIARAGKKDRSKYQEDLEKSAWYLDHKINLVKEKKQSITYTPVIYIAHPFGGEAKNQNKVSSIMHNLVGEHPNYYFVSGVTTFGYCYFDTDYQRRLDMCLWLLHQCDECWIYGDYESSNGCLAEIEYCKENGIPYKIVK